MTFKHQKIYGFKVKSFRTQYPKFYKMMLMEVAVPEIPQVYDLAS